jgi:hypothetical protein
VDVGDTPGPPMAFSLWIVGGSVAVSVGIYIYIARMIERGGMSRSHRPPDFLYSPGLVIIAVVVLLAMLALERFALRGRRVEQTARKGASAIRSLFTQAFVGQIALAESVAIVGLLYFFLGGTIAVMLRFCIVSWILMAIVFARIPSYVSAASRAMLPNADTTDL